MSKIEEAIGFYWGERCPDKHTDCVICQAWSEYDVLNLALRLVAVETAIEIEKWKLKKEQA